MWCAFRLVGERSETTQKVRVDACVGRLTQRGDHERLDEGVHVFVSVGCWCGVGVTRCLGGGNVGVFPRVRVASSAISKKLGASTRAAVVRNFQELQGQSHRVIYFSRHPGAI